MTRAFVVFKQKGEEISRMEKGDLVEAEKVARILNDGLQPKAVNLGFKYSVEVEA